MNRFSWQRLPNFSPEDGAGASSAASPTEGTASSPESSPSPAPSPGEADNSLPSDDNFSVLGEADLDDYETLPPPSGEAAPVAPPASVQPAATPPASAAPPAPAVPAGAQPAPTPAQPQAAPPTPGADQTAQPQPSPQPSPPAGADVPLAERMAQEREVLIGELAAKQFALSKEEADALETDIMGTVPRLLAKVYFDSVTATLNHIQRTVPQIVQQQLRLSQAGQDAEKAFYGMFPALDAAKHGADVNNFALAFRQQPGITQQDLYAMVGAAVMAKHGLSAMPPAAANGGAPPRPSTPAFVPARPGAQVSVAPVPGDQNPFAGLGMSYDEE